MEQRNPIPLKDCDGNKIRAASPENRRAVRAGGKPRMDSSSLSPSARTPPRGLKAERLAALQAEALLEACRGTLEGV